MDQIKIQIFVLVCGFTEILEAEQDGNILQHFVEKIYRRTDYYITLNGKVIRNRDTFEKEHTDQLFIMNFGGCGGSKIMNPDKEGKERKKRNTSRI